MRGGYTPPPPYKLRAIITGSDGSGSYQYKFNWNDDTKESVLYKVGVYLKGKVIASATTSLMHWAPTQTFYSENYIFTIVSITRRGMYSPPTRLSFTAGI